jgi:hypothetical protein
MIIPWKMRVPKPMRRGKGILTNPPLKRKIRIIAED